MKVITSTFLIFALMMGLSGPARAEYDDGTTVPTEVVKPLMAWVERHTGVRVPEPPKVVASRTQLMNVVENMGRLAGRAKAVYVGGGVILDHRAFDPEDDTQLSLLVHELVHYAQSFDRRTNWSCPQAKEVEAYTLQNKWLEERDHSPYVRASWINRMAACPHTDTSVAMASAR